MSPRGFRPPGAAGSRPLRIGPQKGREVPPSIRQLAGAVARMGLRALGRKFLPTGEKAGEALQVRLSPEEVADGAAWATVRHLAQPGFRVVVAVDPSGYFVSWRAREEPREGASSHGERIVAWGSGPTLIHAVERLQQSADAYLQRGEPEPAPEPVHLERPAGEAAP